MSCWFGEIFDLFLTSQKKIKNVPFSKGEGNFLINKKIDLTYKVGMQIQLRFSISQSNRDAELLKYLIQYLGCGKYYPHSIYETGEFIVGNLEDNINKIIPFFDQYSILGTKVKDF